MVDDPKHRIADQDWSSLTLEAFPCTNWCPPTRRSVFDRMTSARTDIAMFNDGLGHLTFNISKASDGKARAWTIRLNLKPNQRAFHVKVDGEDTSVNHIEHIAWDDGRPVWGYFPFGGAGSNPAAKAGYVAEIKVKSASTFRVITIVQGGALKGRTYCAWDFLL